MKKRLSFLPESWLCFGLTSSLFFFVAIKAFAQTAPAIQWDQSFGGSSGDMIYSLKQTPDGGFIVGGNSASGISGDKTQTASGVSDYWILKLNSSGTKIWDKTIGGSSSEVFTCLQITSDGGYILGGYSDSGVGGDKSQASLGMDDYWIVKLDANGNKLWDKTFGGTSIDHLSSLQQTADGGYLLAGGSASGISGDKSQTGRGGTDYWVIKLDANGGKQWDRTFGGNYEDILTSAQQTSDGGYILGGHSDSGMNGDKSQNYVGTGPRPDYWVVKLDAAGNKQWDKTIGGNLIDKLYAFQQTTDGGYILGGESNSGISGSKSQINYDLNGTPDYWIVKLDSNGNKIWDKILGGNSGDVFSSLQQTFDGGFILGGYSNSGISNDKSEANKGSIDYWLVKTDANGTKLWDKSLGGTGNDRLTSLSQTSDGGYVVGGGSDSGLGGDKTQASQGGFDYWIVKLGPEVLGVKGSDLNSAISIFPNPNQGKFNLQLNNLTSPKTQITISDLLGRTILQQEFKTTNNQLSEELSLPNAKGIYLLQLKAGGQISTRKIVVE